MQNIATKVDGVDTLTAGEFNQIPSELENAILSNGIVLASGDLFQLAKTISDYSAHGDFYNDSGSATAYVLTVGGIKQSPTAYIDGYRARFFAGNTNTGAVTVNISALGVKSVVDINGSALVAGMIVSGKLSEITFDSINDRFVFGDPVGIIPTFHATTSAGQSIALNTPTKMQFDTEDFDTNNDFDAVTNYRFTPTVAGKYFIHAAVYCSNMVDSLDFSLRFYKNGVLFKNSVKRSASPTLSQSDFTNDLTVVVDMNGTTDYIEVFVSHGDPTTRTFGSSSQLSYFEGFKIGGVV